MMKIPDWRKWIEDKELCKRWFENYVKRKALKKDRIGIDLYLKKSVHNMDFAGWLVSKHRNEIPELFGRDNFYDWVVIAYYYAIYHSAMALVAERGYSSKSHAATLCAVIWFYYHQKRRLEKEDIEKVGETIEKEDVETVARTKNLRERASYGVSERFESKLAEMAREKAVSFTGKVGNILDR